VVLSLGQVGSGSSLDSLSVRRWTIGVGRSGKFEVGAWDGR